MCLIRLINHPPGMGRRIPSGVGGGMCLTRLINHRPGGEGGRIPPAAG